MEWTSLCWSTIIFSFLTTNFNAFQQLQELTLFKGIVTHEVDWPHSIQHLKMQNSSLLIFHLIFLLLCLAGLIPKLLPLILTIFLQHFKNWSSILTFGKPIYALPPSLSKLSLDYFFDEEINHFPHSLTYLKIRGRFNQPIDHHSPI